MRGRKGLCGGVRRGEGACGDARGGEGRRDLVHAVDCSHVGDEEVEQRAARRNRPVLLACGVDARVGLLGVLELGLDLGGGGLGVLQHLVGVGVRGSGWV